MCLSILLPSFLACLYSPCAVRPEGSMSVAVGQHLELLSPAAIGEETVTKLPPKKASKVATTGNQTAKPAASRKASKKASGKNPVQQDAPAPGDAPVQEDDPESGSTFGKNPVQQDAPASPAPATGKHDVQQDAPASPAPAKLSKEGKIPSRLGINYSVGKRTVFSNARNQHAVNSVRLKTTSYKYLKAAPKQKRTDLCHESHKVFEDHSYRVMGYAARRNSLEGKTIQAVYEISPRDTTQFIDDTSGEYAGYSAMVLEEVKKRTGIETTMTHVPLGAIHNETLSYWDAMHQSNQWLLDNSRRYDLILGLYVQNAFRMNHDMFNPYPLADKSVVLVSNWFPPGLNYWDMLNFIRPFSMWLWLSFFATLFLTGILYWYVEIRQDKDIEDTLPSIGDLGNVVYKNYMAAIQVHDLEATSGPGKIVSCSLTLLGLILSLTYGSILVSFMVGDAHHELKYTDLDDVMARNARICADHLGSEYMAHAHPTYQNIEHCDQYNQETAIGNLVRGKGKCQVAITKRSEYDMAFESQELNSGCNLEVVSTLQTKYAGWIIYDDMTEKCTHLLRDVLELCLNDMKLDGTLDRIYEDFLKSKRTRHMVCNADQLVDDGPDPIGLWPMAGIFTIHSLVLGILFTVYMCGGTEKVKRSSEASQRRSSKGSRGSRGSGSNPS